MSKLVLLINEPRIRAGCQFCESEYTGEGINKKVCHIALQAEWARNQRA